MTSTEGKLYIGALELSVHLSSMNPLGHIDSRHAHESLERILIGIIAEIYGNSGDQDSLLERSIVPAGGMQKFFNFENFSEYIEFCRKVRSALVSKGIPFKICGRRGTISNGDIRDKWSTTLSEFETTTNEERQHELRSLLIREFASVSRDEIESIFRLYRAPSFHGDTVQLGIDTQNFKGLGLHFPKSFSQYFADNHRDAAFCNHFPSPVTRVKHEYIQFLDLKFDFSKSDTVYKTVESGGRSRPRHSSARLTEEHVSATGSQKEIDGLLELLKHSFLARKGSSLYYVSMLTNFIRSSNFSDLKYLEQDSSDTDTGVNLSRGFQFYPPVFAAIFDTKLKRYWKGTPGFEIVLAAMIDEILAAKTGREPSCSLTAEVLEDDIDVSDDELLLVGKTIDRMLVSFGEEFIRKALELPDEIIGRQRRRFILRKMSS